MAIEPRTRAARANPRNGNGAVIAVADRPSPFSVTAKAMKGDREKSIASGASDYITKPVDTDQLLALMRLWLYQ